MLDIPRSTYYHKVQNKPDITKQVQEADLIDKIEAIICELPGYGTRRVTKELKRQEWNVNRKRIQRIMRENSLLHVVKRKFVKTTDSDHPYKRYSNLAKDFIPTGPNQLWRSDITYIRILTGFVYLAVILDAFSRKVIGYALSRRLADELTITALDMAIVQRNPPEGCIHHSDQGGQYASDDYIKKLTEHGFKISMSRVGNPYDNAMAESFMKTLKYEEVYLWDYKTMADVLKRIPYFISQVYNKKRLHSSLGYVPPEEFESVYDGKEKTILTSQLVTL
jgi:transposase InsO family protein